MRYQPYVIDRNPRVGFWNAQTFRQDADGFVFTASDAGKMAGEADALSPEMLAEVTPASANADTAPEPDTADLLSEPAMASVIDDMFAL